MEILQASTLLIVIGMWVGGINSLESQLLKWLDAAEIEREKDRVESRASFQKLSDSLMSHERRIIKLESYPGYLEFQVQSKAYESHQINR